MQKSDSPIVRTHEGARAVNVAKFVDVYWNGGDLLCFIPARLDERHNPRVFTGDDATAVWDRFCALTTAVPVAPQA